MNLHNFMINVDNALKIINIKMIELMIIIYYLKDNI